MYTIKYLYIYIYIYNNYGIITQVERGHMFL